MTREVRISDTQQNDSTKKGSVSVQAEIRPSPIDKTAKNYIK